MFGPEYVWILHPDAGTIEDWNKIAEYERVKSNNETNICTREQFQQAAGRAFILEKNILYRTDENTTTASGLVRKLCLNDLSQSGRPRGVDNDLKQGMFGQKAMTVVWQGLAKNST